MKTFIATFKRTDGSRAVTKARADTLKDAEQVAQIYAAWQGFTLIGVRSCKQ